MEENHGVTPFSWPTFDKYAKTEESWFYVFPAGARDFSSKCPDRLWGPHSLLFSGYRVCFPGAKAAGEPSWEHSPQSTVQVKNPWSFSLHVAWWLFKQKFYSRCNIHINISSILPLDDEHIASMGNTEASIKAESTAIWTNEDVALQKRGAGLVVTLLDDTCDCWHADPYLRYAIPDWKHSFFSTLTSETHSTGYA